MDNFSAFAMGAANRGKPIKVFDWIKAAKIIKESGQTKASAGLSGDWEYTGGVIFEDGKPNFDEYTYLASTWATPELEIGDDLIDCWIYQKDSPDWDSDTKWPKEALDILKQ